MRIYQVETTNYCNATCDYCPHTSMTREKGFISLETVQKVIDNCLNEGQTYIALHHLGEPLLHPNINTIIKMFYENNINTELSTNGLILTAKKLAELNKHLSVLRIAMDFNFAQKKDKLYKELITYFNNNKNNMKIYLHTVEQNDLTQFTELPVTVMNKTKDNWAGQIQGESQLSKSNNCYFLDYNYGVVLWNGDIVSCCLDSNGINIIGNINKIQEVVSTKFSLCDTCVKLQFADGGGWSK